MAPDDRWLSVPLVAVALAVVLIDQVGWAVTGGVMLVGLLAALLYRSRGAPMVFG